MTTSEKRGAPETPRAASRGTASCHAPSPRSPSAIIDETDRAILNALAEERGSAAVYLVRRLKVPMVTNSQSQWVASRLRLLEKAGLVKREQGKAILLWLRTAAGTEALG